MKKISIILLLVVFCITGCGKVNKDSLVNDFKKEVNKAKSYELSGTMEIINDEDSFKYNIDVKYLYDDEDFYKVKLVNEVNNHEQIILKNSEGIYVVTPSLNKSFKFQSNWPDNSSQSYLLKPILKDITNDDKKEFITNDDMYIIKNKVSYPNNEELKYEKIYFDKNNKIKKVEVYNDKDIVKIKVDFNKINMKASLDDDDFKLEDLITTEECSTNCDVKESSSIKDIIYPLYVPTNTSLKSKDVVNTENGERVILTFAGDNSFVLVEETANLNQELEIIPVYGEPEIINDSIGALSNNSLSWTSNNINYYLTGTNLDKNDLIKVATSMNNVNAVNAEK